MTDRRYFVTLSATCPASELHTVVDHLSAGLPGLADALPGIEGLSLSFTREDAEQFSAETVALPVVPDTGPPAGPVTSTGPGTPPPDAATGEQP